MRHYGVKYLGEGSGYKVSIQENHRRRRNHDAENEKENSKGNKFYNEILDFGKTTIKYNDVNISVNIIQFDRPLQKGEMGTDFHKEMELQVLNNESTLDENKEQLRNFCKESMEYYNKELIQIVYNKYKKDFKLFNYENC